MAVEELEQSGGHLDMLLKERREIGDVNLTTKIFKFSAFAADWPLKVVTTEGIDSSKL